MPSSSTVKLGFNLKLIAKKLFQLFPIQKNVLYNILKILRNPLGGKHRKSTNITSSKVSCKYAEAPTLTVE